MTAARERMIILFQQEGRVQGPTIQGVEPDAWCYGNSCPSKRKEAHLLKVYAASAYGNVRRMKHVT